MTELKEARTELARLNSKAQDLLKELMDVRLAIAEQQTKISELIRQRPPVIRLLPNEILACIFSIVFRTDPRPLRKDHLAAVSRQWRDAIMENQTFWSYIDLPQGERPDFRKVLKRSQGALLGIVMPINGSPRDLEYRPNYLVDALEIIGPHAYRWRSLHVIDRRSNP